jgi:hypothetical protein
MDRELLARLHPKTRPETWLKSLAAAGVPFEGAGAKLYRLAHALTNAEDALRDTHRVDKTAWAVPPRWGCWAGLLYLLFYLIAAQQQHVEDRYILLGLLIVATCAVVVGLAFRTWLRPQLRTLHRHSQTDVVRAERDKLRAELVAARDAYLAGGSPRQG